MATDETPAKDEEVKEENTSQEENTPVENQETPQTQETPEDKQTTPTVDVNAITEEATQKAEEKVMKRIADALGMTKEDQDQAKEEGLVPPWEKEGRNPKSYKEVAEYSADLALWKKEQAEKAAEEQKKAEDEEQKKNNEQWNKYWDDEYEELVTTGKIPKVENADDPNDPGNKARKALWQKLYDVNIERTKEGKQPITSLARIYAIYWEDPNAQPAGADAPVSLGRRAGTGGDSEDFSYDEIHNQSFGQIISKAK